MFSGDFCVKNKAYLKQMDLCICINRCPKSSVTDLKPSDTWPKTSANDLGGVGKKVHFCCKQRDDNSNKEDYDTTDL